MLRTNNLEIQELGTHSLDMLFKIIIILKFVTSIKFNCCTVVGMGPCHEHLIHRGCKTNKKCDLLQKFF